MADTEAKEVTVKERYPSPQEMDNQTITALINGLAAGRINAHNLPQAYLEMERIVSPDSPEGLAFQNEMTKVMEKVLPSYDAGKQHERPIIFLLSEHLPREGGYENAYVIPTEKASIVCFDKKIFESFRNLNQLAYVLLHEMTHHALRDLLGEGHNSQTEEGVCDLRPLDCMAKANLAMNEAAEWIKKSRKSPRNHPSWYSLIDPHGLPWHREEAVREGLVALRELRGTEGLSKGRETLDIPAPLAEAVRSAHHISYAERVCNETGFAQASNPEKLRLARAMVPDFLPEYFVRVRDMRAALSALKIDKPERKDCAAAIKPMINEMLDNPHVFNALYPTLDALWQGHITDESKKHYPPGRIETLAFAIYDFLESEEKGENEEQAANALIQAYEQFPARREIHWRNLSLPSFDLLSEREYKRACKEARRGGEPVMPPWENLAEIACSQTESPVRRALWLLSAYDPRLAGSAGTKDLGWFCSNIIRDNTLSTPTDSEGELFWKDLDVADNGSIKGMSADESLTYNKYSGKIFMAMQRRRSEEDLEKRRQDAATANELTFLNMPYAEFFAKQEEILSYNLDLLAPPVGMPLMEGLSARVEYAMYQSRTRDFVHYLDGMLSVPDADEREAYRGFVRDLFNDKNKSFPLLKIRGAPPSRFSSNSRYLTPHRVVLPYWEFLLEDKHQLFSQAEKMDFMLSGLDCLDSMDDPAIVRRLLGCKKPENDADLESTLFKYKAAVDTAGKFFPKQVSSYQETLNNFAGREVEQFILSHGKESRSLFFLLAKYPEFIESATSATTLDGQNPDLVGNRIACRQKLLKLIQKEENWPDNDPLLLARIYKTLQQSQLFPGEEWRADFATRLEKSISEAADDTARMEAAEVTLMAGAPLRDTELRGALIGLWTNACVKKYGKDDGSEAYRENIRPLLQRVAEQGGVDLRYEMLKSLGDAIVSQRNLSHDLEAAYWGKTDRKGFEKTGLGLGISQFLLDELSKEKENRMETARFLSSPISSDSIKRFSEANADAILMNAYIANNIHKEVAIHFLLASATAELNLLKKRPALYKATAKLECKRFYDNFWQSPMLVRTGFLKQLLLPTRARILEQEAGVNDTYNEACDFVIKELLPDGMPHAEQSREMLRAFLAPGVLDEVAPVAGEPADNTPRALFLSALMAATQRTQNAETSVRIGQRLATFLEMMGPAWKKLGQAISSHPDTPRDIAEDMEPLKGKADIPRWKMWALYEQTVPKELRDQHPQLGPVLGSASFFTAVDAGESVFTMQSPYAKERAADGFSVMERLINELNTGKYAIGAALPNSLSDMVRSARISAALETSGRVGAAQAEAMAKVYNGSSVKVNGTTFTQEAAEWYDCGPEFRRMKKMQGPVFNEVPEETAPDKDKKRKAAKARFAYALRNILCGAVPINPDEHGRNFCLDGTHLGLFDPGAVHAIVKDRHGLPVEMEKIDSTLENGGTIEIPTSSHTERMQLVSAIFESFRALRKGTPLAVVMHQQIEAARTPEQTPDYLIRVERGLLALNDCYKYLNQEDVVDILAGLYNGGGEKSHFHKEIREKLENDLYARIDEFEEVSAGDKLKLGIAKRFGKNPGQIILGKVFETAKEPVVIEPPAMNIEVHSPKWWDMPKNKQDIPTLCSLEELTERVTPVPVQASDAAPSVEGCGGEQGAAPGSFNPEKKFAPPAREITITEAKASASKVAGRI